MANPSCPSPFLRLPREIRDDIYGYILHARTSPPLNPSFPGERIWRDDIYHPQRYASWRYPNLVWVNRQLRNEYIELVSEFSKTHQTKAELDIMSKGYVFYPTWVYLPPDLPGETPFDLCVNLRIFSTEAYRSHDGWPRQPGSGFRCLFRLLNQLIQHGPSFGFHLELLRGRWLFAINRMSVNISFHDYYTPDTWPETAHNIFRMLKALAVDGIAKDVIKTVHAHTEYEENGKLIIFDREWEVQKRVDGIKARAWRDIGFLSPLQNCLGDDYRQIE